MVLPVQVFFNKINGCGLFGDSNDNARSVACPDLPPHPSQPTELAKRPFGKTMVVYHSFQNMWFKLAWHGIFP